MRKEIIRRIIRSYETRVVRYYSLGRFQILRQRFLDEIGQYLPQSGRVLDIGCGFGLFSLYFATLLPKVTIHGIDLSPSRIEMATRAAKKLGIENVRYEVADVRNLDVTGEYGGAYMLDVIHHIPPGEVQPLLEKLRTLISHDGCVIIKDVDTEPRYKRLFTFLLDKMMDPKTPVCYWSKERLMNVLSEVGFRVYQHAMVDYLPYPHMLYICKSATREIGNSDTARNIENEAE